MNNIRWLVTVAAAAGLYATSSLPLRAEPAATQVAASDSKMSDADKRAKAADCSKQADEKKLHGAERKKFREACKRK